ncbi:unnamed protein product [Clonostachys rosea]|uniref:Uncharacterized protein n=1 Tax=Bionectria ochroleuca TaxID=29856 RepID=A0ABY6UTU5_BIOOC|nr:unnamed protein product [Clonostachys rosea]
MADLIDETVAQYAAYFQRLSSHYAFNLDARCLLLNPSTRAIDPMPKSRKEEMRWDVSSSGSITNAANMLGDTGWIATLGTTKSTICWIQHGYAIGLPFAVCKNTVSRALAGP